MGSKIARKRDWKIGDKILLKGDIYPVDLELTVDGIFDGPETANLEMLWYHYAYLDELLKKSRSIFAGNAGTVFLKVQSAELLPTLMHDIDANFANSDGPTRTMTERAFQDSFVQMLGNIRAYILNVSLAVVFSLVFVAGNAMAMSMRERTREVAVLKAIGFTRRMVLSLVLSEAVLVALAGGVLGVLAAKLLFDWSDLTVSGIPGITAFYVPNSTIGWALLLSAAIGLAQRHCARVACGASLGRQRPAESGVGAYVRVGRACEPHLQPVGMIRTRWGSQAGPTPTIGSSSFTIPRSSFPAWCPSNTTCAACVPAGSAR